MRILLAFLLLSGVMCGQKTVSVYFDFNIDVPSDSSAVTFQQWMVQNPEAEVVKISGHTDTVDDDRYNRGLSFRRIMSVVGLLEKNKIKVIDSVELEPMGEDLELFKDPAKNRRVDVYYNLRIEPSQVEAETPVVRRELRGVIDTGKDGFAPEVHEQFASAKPGDLIRIENIHFFLNSEKVIPESSPVLVDLFRTLVAYPEMRIEIHGHMCCNPNKNDTALSYRRARFIFKYLIDGGIEMNRLAFRGFGTARPIHKIPEKNFMEELQNRRVEILILDPIKRSLGR